MLGYHLISVRKMNFSRPLLPDTLENVNHDFPGLETGGKRVLNEIMNTPQSPSINQGIFQIRKQEKTNLYRGPEKACF